MPEPTILAFDTSAAHCAAALLMGGRIVAQVREEMSKGQAERLMPMLQEVMDSQGAVWEELDALGVGTGPGNFTGTRISVSTARGLSLGLAIPAAGISAFEVVRRLLDGEVGSTVTVLPARGDHVLCQAAKDGTANETWQSGRAEFVCHSWLTEPAVIRVSEPLPEFEVYRVNGVAIDCDASVSELPDLGHKTAPAIAELAASRLARKGDIGRPAPLYVRSPDAAPSREAPPMILS